MLEWVVMPSSRGSNLCLLWLLHCRRILYSWATREAPSSLARDQTQAPLHWELRVPVTGSPGKSLASSFLSTYPFPCSVKNINHTLSSNKTENPTQKKNGSWNASGWRTAHSGLHCVGEASTQGPSRKDFTSGTLKATSHPIWRCFKHLSGCWHGGSDSKGSACNAGDLGSIPGLGRSPGGWAWQPTPVFLPGESPRTEEPGGLKCWGSQRVRQDWRLSH